MLFRSTLRTIRWDLMTPTRPQGQPTAPGAQPSPAVAHHSKPARAHSRWDQPGPATLGPAETTGLVPSAILEKARECILAWQRHGTGPLPTQVPTQAGNRRQPTGRHTRLPLAVRKHLRETGACMYCTCPTHVIADCPDLAAKRRKMTTSG